MEPGHNSVSDHVKTPFCAACALAFSLCLGIGPAGAGQDKSAFVKELRAQNAHHLANPPQLPETKAPATLERDWEEKLSRQRWKLSEGPLAATVTLKKGGPPDGLLFMSPVLTLTAKGEKVIEVEGSESFPDNPVFLVQIAEMDRGNPYKEVVFSVYTGGAHCCSDTLVLSSAQDGGAWRKIEAGQFNGGPLGARDLDGDGRHEFATRHNGFLYAFGCYACSTAPLVVLRLEGGKLVDASGDPAYRPHHVDALLDMVERAGDDTDRNAFLAGYVAQKIVLDEGAEAWNLMLEHHDRESEWGREACTAKDAAPGECPPGKTVMLSYPEALKRFLQDAGYEVKE